MSSQETIKIGNFHVLFCRNPRAKHILLKQNQQGEIVLTCPKFCPKMLAVAFAKKQLPWIRAHIQYGPMPHAFEPGETITIVGKKYKLKRGKQTQEEGGVLSLSGEAEFFHRRVCSYGQKKLLPYVQKRVADLTAQMGIKPGRITLRNTSSRWGSCSSTKNLSFCWKIAFAPVEVIDYLVAHEVAHLKQMNHSVRFWSLVDELTPHRRVAEKWLKKNGRALQMIK